VPDVGKEPTNEEKHRLEDMEEKESKKAEQYFNSMKDKNDDEVPDDE
jgi:hypothetical protein